MSKMDEKIIELIKEAEEQNKLKKGKIASLERELEEGVARGKTTINDKEIKFIDKLIINDKVKVTLPENIDLMPEEVAKLKYPLSNRPNVIFTDDTTTINFTFSHSRNNITEPEISDLKEEMVDTFRQAYPKASFYEEGLENFTGKNIGFFDFLSEAADCNVYNLMFFTELDGRILMGSFNCTEDEMINWRPIFKGVLKSIKIL